MGHKSCLHIPSFQQREHTHRENTGGEDNNALISHFHTSSRQANLPYISLSGRGNLEPRQDGSPVHDMTIEVVEIGEQEMRPRTDLKDSYQLSQSRGFLSLRN